LIFSGVHLSIREGETASAIDDYGPSPVEASERFESIDVLRGVALLGILAMNIVGFAWPYPVYETPTLAPGSSWADLAIWMFQHIVFDTKMMTIFSMLFGAGMVLMSERSEARGASFHRTYFRRMVFLLLIGIIHAYFLSEGDILVIYALCGFALYPFRGLSATSLIAIGVCLIGLAFPAWVGLRATVQSMNRIADQVEAEMIAGVSQRGWRLDVFEIREKLAKAEQSKAKQFREDVAIHRGGYRRILTQRAKDVFELETTGFLTEFWWQVGGRMLLGMGLMKLGVFSARRSSRFYRDLATFGYGVGLPLLLADIAANWHHDFFKHDGLGYATGGWWLFNAVSGPCVALAHVSAIVLIYQSGAWPRLMSRLAAVGRMALSNYLFHSLVCTTLFYGYGLGLYARIHRPGLALIVVAIWGVQLWLSPIWLTWFRFGPAEWLWRSLTYGVPQPFLRHRTTVDVPSRID